MRQGAKVCHEQTFFGNREPPDVASWMRGQRAKDCGLPHVQCANPAKAIESARADA
jgi:hypothetical protein